MKFSLESGKTWKTLGYRTVLDLNNRQDIKKYIQSVIEFHDTLDNWYQTVDPEQIVFQWFKTTELDYRRQQNKTLRINKTLPVKIENVKGLKNIPYNINYLDWGSKINRVNEDLVIEDVIIDKTISKIVVKTINTYTKLVNIHYKYNRTTTFNDFQGRNFIRRTLSDGNKVYFNESQHPYFYFNECQSNDLMYVNRKNLEYNFSA